MSNSKQMASKPSLIVRLPVRASPENGLGSWHPAQRKSSKDDDCSRSAGSSERKKLLHMSSGNIDENACDMTQDQRSSEDAADNDSESPAQSCDETQIKSGGASDISYERIDSIDSLINALASPCIDDIDMKESRAREDDSVQELDKAQSGLTLSHDTSAKGTHTANPGFETLLKRCGLPVSSVCPPPAKAPKAKIAYLDLPGEIRNKIMDFALVPGHIYFSIKSQPINYKNSPVFLPGCQLLATCRQAYNEGYVSFYNRNVFHLAPGPFLASMEYFWRLRRKHQSLIEKISIEMSVIDLTPSVLETIETAFYQNRRQSIAHADNALVVCYVMNALRDLWTEKIAAARDVKKFNAITLWGMFLIQPRQPHKMGSYQAPFRGIILEGNGIKKLLSSVNPNKDCRKWGEDLSQWGYDEYYKGWDDKLNLFFRRTVWFVMTMIIENLDANLRSHCGWEQFKEWLRNLDMTTRIPPFLASNERAWCDKIE